MRLTIVCFIAAALHAQGPIQVHGLLQGRFTDQPGTSDRLEIRRVRLVVAGDPVSKLSYRFQADLAKRPYVIDASLAWKFSRVLTVSAGQMKIPFSAESLMNDVLNQPVSRSRAVLGLSPGRDTGVQGRDTGAQISGGLHGGNGPIVEYAAGVFRGQTLVYSPMVHHNAAAGRVVAHPVHGLSVAADWYGSFSAPPNQRKRREELEGEYVRGRMTVRAEQIWARDGSLHRNGGYLLGAWKTGRNFELLTRADWLTRDTHKPNATSVAYIAGANYFLWNHVKTGWNIGAQVDPGPSGISSVMLAQIALYF
jgi:Phosphate-selective porin O and P